MEDTNKDKKCNRYLSEEFTYLIVETDEENPVVVAEITNVEASPAPGYRIRLKPSMG